MLGENIYKLRKDKKITQEQLAEKINVTRQTISNWELGETAPNPEQLKLLSKELNISIDELLNNDVQNLIVEKISNTEKLAGIIIKVLKILGIAFIILLIIDIISLFLFTIIKKESSTKIVNEATINCTINDEDYMITIASDAHLNCSNCSKEIQNNLKDIIDYSNIKKSIINIEEYFKNNNGICN